MAEILPTPRAGTWLKIDSATIVDTTPRAGTWLRMLPDIGPSGPRAGTWLRIDGVTFRRTDGWSVGFLKF
jgi:hypothetical protein